MLADKLLFAALRCAVIEESIDLPEEYRPTGGSWEVTETLT